MNGWIILLSVLIFTILAASLSVPGDFQNDEDDENNGEMELTDEERKISYQV